MAQSIDCLCSMRLLGDAHAHPLPHACIGVLQTSSACKRLCSQAALASTDAVHHSLCQDAFRREEGLTACDTDALHVVSARWPSLSLIAGAFLQAHRHIAARRGTPERAVHCLLRAPSEHCRAIHAGRTALQSAAGAGGQCHEVAAAPHDSGPLATRHHVGSLWLSAAPCKRSYPHAARGLHPRVTARNREHLGSPPRP